MKPAQRPMACLGVAGEAGGSGPSARGSMDSHRGVNAALLRKSEPGIPQLLTKRRGSNPTALNASLESARRAMRSSASETRLPVGRPDLRQLFATSPAGRQDGEERSRSTSGGLQLPENNPGLELSRLSENAGPLMPPQPSTSPTAAAADSRRKELPADGASTPEQLSMRRSSRVHFQALARPWTSRSGGASSDRGGWDTWVGGLRHSFQAGAGDPGMSRHRPGEHQYNDIYNGAKCHGRLKTKKLPSKIKLC